MEKVYCGTCKYLDIDNAQCRHKSNIVECEICGDWNTLDRIINIFDIYPSIINEHNDCENYRPMAVIKNNESIKLLKNGERVIEVADMGIATALGYLLEMQRTTTLENFRSQPEFITNSLSKTIVALQFCQREIDEYNKGELEND